MIKYKKNKIKIVLSIIIFLYLFIFLYSEFPNSSFRDVSIHASLSEFNEYPGVASDFRYYLYTANYIQHFNLVPREEMWILRTWPPGMSIYYALISLITFKSNYFIFFSTFFILLGYSYFFIRGLIYNGTKWKTIVLNVTLVIFVLQLDAIHKFILGDYILLSESLSILLYTSGWALLITSLSKKQINYKILISSGILFGLASYTRLIFDFTNRFVLLALIIGYTITKIFRQQKSLMLKNLIVVFIIAFIVTIPWRYVIYTKTDPGNFRFGNSGKSTMWINSWTKTENLDPYYVDLGLNHLCVSYVETCQYIHAQNINNKQELVNLSIRSITNNPYPWIKNRINTFSKISHSAFEGTFNTNINIILYIVYLLIFYKKMVKNESTAIIMYLFFFSTLLTIFPLILASFETRYFYPIIISPLLILLLSSQNHQT